MARTADEAASGFDLKAMFSPAAGVEKYTAAFLDRRPMPANLREAVRYSLLGPGKRLRPILVVRSCEALGGKAEASYAAAAAMEMIHCFSLVHDDLPAMDDDDLRRGRPTLHKHTNEAMAILAGDVMMGLAFELVASELEPPSLAGLVSLELAEATNNMIAGQVYDTLPDFADTVSPMERLKTIHKNKTGALIRGSCRMGALCGGADPDDIQLDGISRYAEAIGLMFQVVDDLLDVTQTTEHLGKAANKDADKGKLTYPGLLGIEGSKQEIAKLQTAAHEALDAVGNEKRTRHLRDLCDYMAVRSK